jgi:GH15 family glucan-1,4-alpha-glucosidase
MAYVALDRAVRIAQTRRDDHAEVERWVSESQALRSQVRRHGWSDELQTYTAAYGSTDLDASVLLVAMSELENDAPERISSTVDAVRRRLGAGGVLIYRTLESTSPDDAGEGAFIACSFWLIDALARCGRIDEAEKLMSQAVTLGGGLGLLAEECDPASGQMLGNYPQALSHSTLVSAALSIEAAKASKTHRAARRTPRERQA